MNADRYTDIQKDTDSVIPIYPKLCLQGYRNGSMPLKMNKRLSIIHNSFYYLMLWLVLNYTYQLPLVSTVHIHYIHIWHKCYPHQPFWFQMDDRLLSGQSILKYIPIWMITNCFISINQVFSFLKKDNAWKR